MIRRVFAVASVLSLLLCMATVALWVRSFWGSTRLELTIPPHLYAVEAERGCLFVPLYDAGTKVRQMGITVESDPGGGWWGDIPHSRWRGLQLLDGGKFLMISLWLSALLTAALAFVLYRGVPVVRSGGCYPMCAYDPRASTDRCPECGTPIPTDGS